MPNPSTFDVAQNYPQDFLDAFEATNGLCPANPEGDSAFMWFLFVFAQKYAASHVFAPAVIDSINPAAATAGGPDFTMTIIGSGLAVGSTVLFGVATQTLQYVSDTEGTFTVNASEYAQAGTIPVTVQAPGNGTAASNSVDFTAT